MITRKQKRTEITLRREDLIALVRGTHPELPPDHRDVEVRIPTRQFWVHTEDEREKTHITLSFYCPDEDV
jgi:hypothetical protein